MNRKAVISIFKRNLGSYFGSPAGYVFICAFLLASGLAAFWPDEFFNSNMANLEQLNKFLPHILLGFIPAITMSIWAEERRQGTDELLLTLPGSDLDVVLGKYLGAVAIFTVSLLFSLVANTLVLYNLGNPDLGLLFANYFGTLMMGLAMLAVGMVASFLTANLTVAFVLGVAFNAPLALLTGWEWGFARNFFDFNRGVISISGIAFFVGLAVIMLYLCAILIGRRHWAGGPTGASHLRHFFLRVTATIVIAFSFTSICKNKEQTIDATAGKLSKLSQGSINLLKKIDGSVSIGAYISPAQDFPEEYRQTRVNLVSILRELENEGGDKIQVEILELKSTDPAAMTAEEEGIENKNRSGLWVEEKGRGMTWDKDLYMGLVFKGEAGKKTLDFLYKGLPVEYELMRNVMAVGSSDKKKKIGIFTTDVPMMGSAPMGMFGFDMGGGTPPWDFVNELRKQYEVEEVTESPIDKKTYDSLVVVQPSTLDDAKLNDLIAAITAGVPTLIFEDPLPLIHGGFPGTYEPRRSNQSGGPGQPPPPPVSKGDLSKLWNLLGVHFNVDPKIRLEKMLQELENLEKKAKVQLAAVQKYPPVRKFMAKLDELQTNVVELQKKLKPGGSLAQSDWDSIKLDALRDPVRDLQPNDPLYSLRGSIENVIPYTEARLRGLEKRILRDPYNPFPKIAKGKGENIPDEFVYVAGTKKSLGSSEVSAKLQYLLFTAPGALFDAGSESLTFTPLLRTREGSQVGTTSLEDFWQKDMLGNRQGINPNRTLYDGSGQTYTLAASISGKGPTNRSMKVILVADADVITDPFYRLRKEPHPDFPLDVDNVIFALNAVDELTGEKDMLVIRNRRREHRTLEDLEKILSDAQEEAAAEAKKAQDAFDAAVAVVNKQKNDALDEAIAPMREAMKQGSMTYDQMIQVQQLEGTLREQWDREINIIKEKESRKLTKAIQASDRKRDANIEATREQVKNLAVFLPPIPLLIIALVIFAKRRIRELEGASASRVRN